MGKFRHHPRRPAFRRLPRDPRSADRSRKRRTRGDVRTLRGERTPAGHRSPEILDRRRAAQGQKRPLGPRYGRTGTPDLQIPRLVRQRRTRPAGLAPPRRRGQFDQGRRLGRDFRNDLPHARQFLYADRIRPDARQRFTPAGQRPRPLRHRVTHAHARRQHLLRLRSGASYVDMGCFLRKDLRQTLSLQAG